mmetsp:Transcript_3317/g.10365  ORF Transcript_3317/g.10365 Transcript_3317/m.10365 type:complete len:258 (+) Transcript_3317:211-984(+)
MKIRSPFRSSSTRAGGASAGAMARRALTTTSRTASTCATMAQRSSHHSERCAKSASAKFVPPTRLMCVSALSVNAAVTPRASLYAATTSARLLAFDASADAGGVSTPTSSRSRGAMWRAIMPSSACGSRAFPRLEPSSMKLLRSESRAASARPCAFVPTIGRTRSSCASPPRAPPKRARLAASADADTSSGTYVVGRTAAEASMSGATFSPLPAEHSTHATGGSAAPPAARSGGGSSANGTSCAVMSRRSEPSTRVR